MIKISIVLSGRSPFCTTSFETETDTPTAGEIAGLNDHCKHGLARHSPELQKVAEVLLQELLGRKAG